MKIKTTIKLFVISLFSISFILSLNPKSAYALSYTWDGGGATNNWSDCDNWSTNTCPISGDTVTFDATSTKNSIIDAGAANTISAITITSVYSGIVTQAQDLILTGDFSQAGGTYNGGNNNLEVRDFSLTGGNFNAPSTMTALGVFSSIDISGGIFTAPSNNLYVRRAFTVHSAAYFVHNNGTITFTHPANGSRYNIICNNAVFNHVVIEAVKYVRSGCSLPLGHNPIAMGTSQSWPQLYVEGELTGTGTLTVGDISSGQGLWIGSGGALTGFTGLKTGRLTVAAAGIDLSGIGLVDAGSRLVLSSGATLVAPPVLTTEGYINTSDANAFIHNNGTVVLTGVANELNGDITFFNLVKEAIEPSTITFQAGTTQVIEGLLTLKGLSESGLLSLVSSTPGVVWNINVTGSQSLRYLSIQDANNTGATLLLAYDSESAGNNTSFQFLATPPPAEPEAISPDTELADTGANQITFVIASLVITLISAGYIFYQRAGTYKFIQKR